MVEKVRQPLEGARKILHDAITASENYDYKSFSAAIGRNPTYIQQHILYAQPEYLKEKERKKASDLLSIDETALMEPEFRRLFVPTPNASRPIPAKYGRSRRPMFGQVYGGAADQGRILMNEHPIGYRIAPPIVEHVPEAFALKVSGDSMLERFRDGDTAWVNPNLDVIKGDDVFIELLDDDRETRIAYVKRFVSRSPRELVVKQLNPPDGESDTLRFPGSRVLRVHLIVDIGVGR